MTTLANTINMINNGDVPSFADLSHHFYGMDLWHIRNACFGDSNAAQAFCASHDLAWQLGYDNRAVVRMDATHPDSEIKPGTREITVISVTTSHALIVAALTAIEMKKARAGT